MSTLLRLTGRDALDLLHRLSTQSLAALAPLEARAMLLCDFRGRLLHRAAVAVGPDGAVWLARPDAPGADLAAFLDRFVFREDVRIEDLSAGRPVRLGVGRDGAPEGAAAFEGNQPRRFALPRGERLRIGPAAAPAPEEEGAELARIRAGLPRHGHEIREDFTPFEVGLAREVHLAKGCFTGQEALHRLVTYHSVRRTLALLGLRGATPAPRAALVAGGERAGEITSALGAPGNGLVAALAVVSKAALESDAPLALEDGTPVESVERFTDQRPLGLPA